VVRWLGGSAKYAVLIFFLLVFSIPFIWLVSWSLKTEIDIVSNPFSAPIPPHWENFARVWTQGRYSRYLPNTVVYAISIVIGVCFFSCMTGYALARMRFPGRDALFTLILVGTMVPFQAIMIPLYYLARDLHILGTRWGLIIPSTALGLPFGVFMMRAFFRSLPEELADAARIDGCSEWGIFGRVMLPLAGPGLTALAVFQFMWSWNVFLPALILVQRDVLRPVALGLLYFAGRYTQDRSMIAGGVMFTIIPIIVLYLLLQHKFIEGVTAGALK
jgi:ABC-type glycerol-3-phosphate transport system permease component